MSDPTANFATARMASAALFVNGDRIFLVHKTHANGWDIPGGYVDKGESTADACGRELKKELDLDRDVPRLLAVDWAPRDDEAEKILFMFDCGDLSDAW
jgi:8-oxo-dGTP diphosphatase